MSVFRCCPLGRSAAGPDAGEAVLVVPQQGRNRRKCFLIQLLLPTSLLGGKRTTRCPLPVSPEPSACCAPAGGPARAAAPPGSPPGPQSIPAKKVSSRSRWVGSYQARRRSSARSNRYLYCRKGVRFTLSHAQKFIQVRTHTRSWPRQFPTRCRWPGLPSPGGTACAPPGRRGRCRR